MPLLPDANGYVSWLCGAGNQVPCAYVLGFRITEVFGGLTKAQVCVKCRTNQFCTPWTRLPKDSVSRASLGWIGAMWCGGSGAAISNQYPQQDFPVQNERAGGEVLHEVVAVRPEFICINMYLPFLCCFESIMRRMQSHQVQQRTVHESQREAEKFREATNEERQTARAIEAMKSRTRNRNMIEQTHFASVRLTRFTLSTYFVLESLE